jgi:hypothetical protein
MFMMLMNGVAWLVVIGLGVLAFMFASAGLGALIGNTIVALRRMTRWLNKTEVGTPNDGR